MDSCNHEPNSPFGDIDCIERLDERFPQRVQSDEMSEVLTEIFSLRTAEGEGVQAWISRATEMFDKCCRQVSVSFPEEAQGWLILHRSGINEEQKAVCLARSLGDLKRESIGRAMRSVYPEFTCAKRRTNAVAVVDSQALDDDGADYDDGTDLDVREIEQFLADHDQATGDDSVFRYSEGYVQHILKLFLPNM